MEEEDEEADEAEVEVEEKEEGRGEPSKETLAMRPMTLLPGGN